MCSFPNCLLFLICDFQYCCRSRTTGGSYAAPSERFACSPSLRQIPLARRVAVENRCSAARLEFSRTDELEAWSTDCAARSEDVLLRTESLRLPERVEP
jgi:hypothetical protein